MGQATTKTAKDRSYPSVAEIVEEIRKAKAVAKAGLIKGLDLAEELGMERSNFFRTCRRMSIQYAWKDADGTAYITQEDAKKIAEKRA